MIRYLKVFLHFLFTISLIPLITGKSKNHRETAFVHYNPNCGRFEPGRFIRTENFKLYNDGRFYDLQSDSMEENPMDMQALDKKQQEVFMLLSNKLNQHPRGDIVDNN